MNDINISLGILGALILLAHVIGISLLPAWMLLPFKKNGNIRIKLNHARRNLMSQPGRTALVIVALIIGLWGLGSLMVSYTILKNDLNQNYMDTIPAHVVLESKDFKNLDLGKFTSQPEIECAEFRDLSKERVQIGPDIWVPLWLFGVHDFNDFNLAQFYREQGQKVPAPGTILIERNGTLISELSPGKNAIIGIAGPKILSIPISGLSFDPSLAPSTMDHWIYAYADSATFTQITGKPVRQRLILRFNDVTSTQDVELKTNDLLKDFKGQGIVIKTVSIPDYNEHPHQFQLTSLLIMQGGIGLLAFLMGTVLVWQLMDAVLARQVIQIGILKAIGASRVRIFNIYFTMVFILGAVSTMIALPLAIWSGFSFAEFVSSQLNFNIITQQLPSQTYTHLIVVGLFLPFLASLGTLVKAVNKPVVQALTDYGINPSDTGKQIPLPSQLLKKIPNLYQMVIRNLFRRRARLFMTLLTMALGVAIFSTGFNLRQALVVLLEESKNAMKYDVRVQLREPVLPEKVVKQFEPLIDEYTFQTWGGGKSILKSSDSPVARRFDIVAMPWNTGSLKPMLVKGEWLGPQRPNGIVINSPMLEYLENPEIGDTFHLTFNKESMEVTLEGIVKQFARPTIYIDQDIFDQHLNPEGHVSYVIVDAKNKASNNTGAIQIQIEKFIKQGGINVASTLSMAGVIKIIYDHLNILLTLLTLLALLVLIVSALGLASATSINIMERTREIGILRAIGATPKKILFIFLSEGMMVCLAGIVLGLILAWPLSIYVSAFFGNLILETQMDFAFSRYGLLITLTVTGLFTYLACRIPAQRAVKVSTRDALNYE